MHLSIELFFNKVHDKEGKDRDGNKKDKKMVNINTCKRKYTSK
jgi:hypothetical protein